ncbi:hypothetical protein NI17_019605 [Thermobifida halotolerans]|uniref:Uncharacterized protein n=1 Tax=Thermobifida halotolerans TaxID=483545 RepID=A0A399FW90_9ACTN|nr:hypothetical protein [Thermobifida halotolerans]UOE18947.1 hypothetical protein NI17_019605 [Thermobifida halotolerans]
MHGTSLTRLTRAGVFAAVCVGVSANGHAFQAGHGVPLGGTLLGLALMLAVGWAIAGRERGGGTILGWMLWGQLALHLVFGATQSDVGTHSVHQATTLTTAAAGQPSSSGMLAAHLGAALVCALWLRRGEAAAFRLARELRILLSGVLLLLAPPPAVPCPPEETPLRGSGPAPAVGTLLRHTVVRRGPPPPRSS